MKAHGGHPKAAKSSKRVDALVMAELDSLSGEMMDARQGAIAKRRAPKRLPENNSGKSRPPPAPKKEACPKCGGGCPMGRCEVEEGLESLDSGGGSKGGGVYVGRDAHAGM